MQRCQQAIARVLYLWTEHWMNFGLHIYIKQSHGYGL